MRNLPPLGVIALAIPVVSSPLVDASPKGISAVTVLNSQRTKMPGLIPAQTADPNPSAFEASRMSRSIAPARLPRISRRF
ncbi:MAG: hypothetical protein NZ847_16345, partial [Acidobacteria bacterium]|nr:hypothetical protein [Acidobacteriota bacterium]